jgi:ATP-dependent exoDNAse (exonuclease V) beta subunit
LSEQSFFTVYNASAGSGKTYTLVRDYLVLLLDPKKATSFQRILAITFTNKAAGEMKDRVLQYLVQFATTDPRQSDDMREYLMAETGLSDADLKERSLDVLQQILKDYGSFNIKTIDSFTNKLIKSFAFDLGLSMDFEVELDTDSIFQEAVDELVSRIGQDAELTKILVSFSKQKAEDDRSWDISRDLLEISRLLLNENHLKHLEKLRKKKLSDFRSLYKSLAAERKRIGDLWKEKGLRALELIDSQGLVREDFFRKQVPVFFEKLANGNPGVVFAKGSSIEQNLEAGKLYAQGQKQEVKDAIDLIAAELHQLYLESERRYEEYCLYDLILNNLVPLAVLSSIYRILEEIKTENNIRLNAEFNQLISEHLREQHAAFIYERIGEKFKYFFIDEMQDTSVLQWLNLIPLLSNALSGERAGLMLVGDAKQAIYRWRGGRAEQFIDLSAQEEQGSNHPFVVPKEVKNLGTNYRSYSQIIDFNNSFFSHLSGFFSDDSYSALYRGGNNQNKNSRTGGYVELQFLDQMRRTAERDQAYPAVVYEKVRELLKQYQPQEICILVRKKAQGAAIAKLLTQNGVDILSSETLLLRNNKKVDFIIQFLRLEEDPNNQEALFEILNFLHGHWNLREEAHSFFARHLEMSRKELFESFRSFGADYQPKNLSTYSVYEGVEAIIRSFALNESSDAFLQFFLDFVFDYTQRRSQKGAGFLEYWDEKKDKLNITTSEDAAAVRIMTIHKSKGLEFPVVIFPYDLEIYGDRSPVAWYEPLRGEIFQGFESLLVSATTRIQNTGERGREIYADLRKEQELDSSNLLYVCLTRAVEQLYVITEKRKSQDEPKYASDLFTSYLKDKDVWEEDRMLYAFGSERRASVIKESAAQSEQQKELISSSWQDHDLHLVSKSSLLWDTHRGEAIGYGNLVHELMARIEYPSDLDSVIQGAINSGWIRDSERESMKAMLTDLITHPELEAYFDQGLEVINERPILLPGGNSVIPDRLVFMENKVWILDYKTGVPDAGHQRQIDQYGRVLEAMGYSVQEKALAYLGQTVEVIKIQNKSRR